MRLGELCAGYGGLGMAVEEVFGAATAWFSEFDEAPSKILAHHWPTVPNYGDMTKIDWAGIEPVDIISGGTPCQDLSAAGRRAGMTEGTRSNLWVQMREAIAMQRPRYVVWENVRGAYSAEASSDVEYCAGCMGSGSDCYLRALGRVLGDLSDLGYDCQWRGLRAADIGAPHGRFRVFVLATNPLSAGTRIYSDARGQERRQAHPRSATLVRPEHWKAPTERGEPSNSEPVANSERLRGERWGVNEDLASAPRTGEEDGGEWKRDGNAIDDSQPVNWGEYQLTIARWEARLGRRVPRPTEPTGRDSSPRLSPAFVEWMMGLPEGWVTAVPGVNRSAQLKALGNGVVPQQAAAALRDMLAAFEQQKEAA